MTTNDRPPRLSLERRNLLPNLFHGTDEEEAVCAILAGDVRFPIFGQFACVLEDANRVVLVRDRLGLNKLFYHLDSGTRVMTVGHSLFDLAAHTGSYNEVHSVPAGHYLVVDRDTCEKRLQSYWDLSLIEEDPQFEVADFHTSVDRRLSDFFRDLAKRFPDTHFFVCLSGGLDSSIIASYARTFLPNASAVSFSYEALSDDFMAAKAIAKTLGMPFIPVIEKMTLSEETLCDVIRSSQDWRDFNVHCAWVNYHIARYLRSQMPDDRHILLTGDLMNEFVVDYKAEQFDGSTYYALPKVSQGRLRRFLVSGLDSSDRELGVFHRFGFTAIQPYAMVAEMYLTVPASLLEDPDCKGKLNRSLIRHPEILHLIGEAKVRAQVGGSDGGTLGLFHRNGITQEGLNRRWRETFEPVARGEPLQPLIIAGRYRS